MGILLLDAFLVVLLSHCCSLAEAAILSLPLVRARALGKLGGPAARAVLRVKEQVGNAVSAVVILNTLVNIFGTYFITDLTLGMVEAGQLPKVAGVLSPILLGTAVVVLGEIVPKTLGERFHVAVSLAAAYPVLTLMRVLHPLLWLSEKALSGVRPSHQRHEHAEEEISILAQEAHEAGSLQSAEARVIARVFRLNDITSEDVMSPRIRCVMLPGDATLEGARADLSKHAFSRIPLFAGTRDQITGVLRRSEALVALVDGRGHLKLKDLATRAKFVPATMPADRLLLEFQRERVQMAVVVGEYGETVGLVTLEDIMEELVGEMLDEKQVDERSIKRVSREEILVHGQTEVTRINHFFNTELPEDSRPTIAGLLLEELGRLPRPGERILMHGVAIVVDEANDRAIVRVRILKSTGPPAPGAPVPSLPPGEGAFA